MPEQDAFHFSADVSRDAMNDLAVIADASEPPAPAEPAAAVATETPAPEEAPQEPPSAPPEPEFIDVTAAGQRLKVTRDELIRGYQRDVDYRQKTMQLADERRALQAQLEQERGALRAKLQEVEQVLADPLRVAEAQRQMAAQQGLPVDDQEVMTAGQVKHLLIQERARIAQELTKVQQNVVETQAAARAAQEKAQYEREYIHDLTAWSKELLRKHPILEDVEKIDLLLLSDARDASPGDIQQVKDLMAESAARRAAKLERRLADHTKMAVVRQAKVSSAKATIEPPSGQAPPPTQPRTRPLRIGDADLTAQVIADLTAGTGGGRTR